MRRFPVIKDIRANPTNPELPGGSVFGPGPAPSRNATLSPKAKIQDFLFSEGKDKGVSSLPHFFGEKQEKNLFLVSLG